MNGAGGRLDLDFWGARTTLVLPTPEDLQHFHYYFRGHEDLREEFAEDGGLEVAFCVSEPAPFTSDSRMRRTIRTRMPGRSWAEYESYRSRPTRPTPVPPFAFAPLANCVRTFHGSAATAPWDPDCALVVLGGSTAGKSCVLLELLQRGWAFVTDDTVVATREGTLLRYLRPVGVRQDALARNTWLQPAARVAMTFATGTGKTYAINPLELPVRMASERSRWRWTLRLTAADDYAFRVAGPMIEIDLAADRHSARAADDLCEHLAGGAAAGTGANRGGVDGR